MDREEAMERKRLQSKARREREKITKIRKLALATRKDRGGPGRRGGASVAGGACGDQISSSSESDKENEGDEGVFAVSIDCS